jgi:hypothetical protein
MATDLSIRVSGMPLELVCLYGDIEMSTVWPGGSGELSWSTVGMPASLARGQATVEAYVGPERVWYGTMDQPDPSQERLTAQGLWRLGDNFDALNSDGTASTVPNDAIDYAITRGLKWKRPTSIQATAVDIDVSQGPVKLGALLDAMCEDAGTRWGVDTAGNVVARADSTTPVYTCLPLDGGLGYALDDFASALLGRYIDSSDSKYHTVIVTDALAVSQTGVYREGEADLTPRGPITGVKATKILTNILALGRSKPQFTENISFAYGELLTANGSVAVALETAAAGGILRVPGGLDLARSGSGDLFVDVPIGQTTLSEGILTIQPLQAATRNFTDVLTAALKKK